MEGVSARVEESTISLPPPLLLFSAVTPNMRVPPESQKGNIKNKSSLHIISTSPKIVTIRFRYHFTYKETKAQSG